MRYFFFKTLILTIAASVLYSPSWGKEKPKSRSVFLLGTVCSISIFDKHSNSIMDRAFDIVKEIDLKMGMERKNSEVNLINISSGSSAVQVSADTYKVITHGIAITSFSGGSFDITVGPLVSLWGIGTARAKVPSQNDINKTLGLIGIENIVLQENKNKVFLKKSGMKLDLGGIAKGYAADAVVDYLKGQGVSRAIIDFGGNIFVLGSKGENLPWRIGIQDPEKRRGAFIGVLPVSNKAIVTSGKYERYLEVNGIRYHHILDTSTGSPVENRLSSVTIITHDSMTADAMSTAVIASGLTKGLKMAEEYEGLEAVLVMDDRLVYLSSGIDGIFKISVDEYHLANLSSKPLLYTSP